MTYCAADNSCCSSGFKCTVCGCVEEGAVYCGGTRCCPAGQKCTRTGSCIPSTAEDCGDGHHCKDGKVCWTSPSDYRGHKRNQLYCVDADERAKLNQEIAKAKLDARDKAKQAALRARDPLGSPATRAVVGKIPAKGSPAVDKTWSGWDVLKKGGVPADNSAVTYGYCTDYVRSVFSNAGNQIPFGGNASQWFERAKAHNTKFTLLEPSQIGRVPAGAIAVWGNRANPMDPNKPGHVAIVSNNDPTRKASSLNRVG